jgi:hypothetical protein
VPRPGYRRADSEHGGRAIIGLGEGLGGRKTNVAVRGHQSFSALRGRTAEAHSGVPDWVEEDFRAYLRCGILAHGFARVRCDVCATERLVAFSCSFSLGTIYLVKRGSGIGTPGDEAASVPAQDRSQVAGVAVRACGRVATHDHGPGPLRDDGCDVEVEPRRSAGYILRS